MATDEGRFQAFRRIKAHYDQLDREGLARGELPMRDTPYGFWGTSNMDDAYRLFVRIRLERFRRFGDLGGGDGRIAAIASLFTEAEALEGDDALAAKSEAAFRSLQLARATTRRGDFLRDDLSRYDLLFIFPDKEFEARLIGKLLSEFTGWLLVYGPVYAPPFKKGRTYWIGDTRIVSYPVAVAEESLEQESQDGSPDR